MKKVLGLCLVMGLVGCATTANFFELTPTPTNDSGYWTGQYDRLVGTLRLNTDGTGLICQDAFGTARVMSVKVVGDKLYSQDGTYWKIANKTNSSMNLNYAIGGGYTMNKDDTLKNITPACAEKLK